MAAITNRPGYRIVPLETCTSASVIRTHPPGVTVLLTTEGPSPRSDPRWTPQRAERSERLLDRLIARRRHARLDA